MKIKLVEIDNSTTLANRELRSRCTQSSKSLKTTHYIAYDSDTEVAFVSIDRWPEASINCLVLYEIFVPSELRGTGIGSHVLQYIEKVALQERYDLIRLYPQPLDKHTDPTKLANWYHKNGYKARPDISRELVKCLKGAA